MCGPPIAPEPEHPRLYYWNTSAPGRTRSNQPGKKPFQTPWSHMGQLTLKAVTWMEYFAAASGLPISSPRSASLHNSSDTPTISHQGPVPQSWTDYCLVMGGHWVYNPAQRPILPRPNTWTLEEILELHS
eukprot:15612197-Heterocapsa_arctica.AAC.1